LQDFGGQKPSSFSGFCGPNHPKTCNLTEFRDILKAEPIKNTLLFRYFPTSNQPEAAVLQGFEAPTLYNLHSYKPAASRLDRPKKPCFFEGFLASKISIFTGFAAV
jgi:hypothetical protein